MDREYMTKEKVISEKELMKILFPNEADYILENVLIDIEGYRFILKKEVNP